MSAAHDHRGLAGLTDDELRAAVREVLRDVLPSAVTDRPRPREMPTETVDLRDDADLDAFVRRVAALCVDPAQRVALVEGLHGFRLAHATREVAAGASAAPGGSAPEPGVTRVEAGAVTERTIARVAATGDRLVLGRRAVLTPLGRDRARSLGVTVEKET